MVMNEALTGIMKMQMTTEGENDPKNAMNDSFFYTDEFSFPVVSEMHKAMLLLPESVQEYTTTENSVTLKCSGRFFEKHYFYRFFDFRPTFNQLKRTRTLSVKITLCSEDTLRVQMAQSFSVPEHQTEMLAKDHKKTEVLFTTKETDTLLIIGTTKIRVEVQKKPWNLSVYTMPEGQLVYQQMGEDDRTFMKFEDCPFGFLYDEQEKKVFACESATIDDDEHFYGFGEKFSKIDKKGQKINLWNTNGLGVYTERTYKNIPFFMSTKGYGMFIHSSSRINCNMGAHSYKAYSIMTEDDSIDYYLIVRKQMKDILKGYTDITGQPGMPPLWSFGFWISKISYESREQVETVAKRFRQERIPCDVIHIDTNWYRENWVCDYRFCDQKFPQAQQMIEALRKQGFRISLWQMPYIDQGVLTNNVYTEGFEKGYFAFAPEGTSDFRHGLIDFSNPDAVKWYQEKLLQPLLEMGVAAIKVDFGESAPSFYQYAGELGKDMHNLYALLYNKACYETSQKVHGEEGNVIWARSAWAGSQRYPLHWGGDCGTDFQALITSIKAGLSFGLSGFPFWSHDVGGFFYASDPELYTRWLQVGAFSSHMRAHGFYTREPWDFGDEAKENAKKYLRLRYALMPYIYSQAKRCIQTSLPMMRALVLEYQEDENVHAIDNQYLFGDCLLVAPVLHRGARKRKLYLPKGCWIDWWTAEVLQGGRWIEKDAPLDILPLYVKDGSLIPLCQEMDYTTQAQWNPIRLKAFFANESVAKMQLYEGQTEKNICASLVKGQLTVTLPLDDKEYFIEPQSNAIKEVYILHKKQDK